MLGKNSIRSHILESNVRVILNPQVMSKGYAKNIDKKSSTFKIWANSNLTILLLSFNPHLLMSINLLLM